jgi:hypothetical protein
MKMFGETCMACSVEKSPLHWISMTEMQGLPAAYGAYGVNLAYAMAARRPMHLFGTTSEQPGAIANE